MMMIRLTQEELAARLGKSRSYVSKILSGKRNPALPLALNIYRHAGLKLGPLADKTDSEIETLRQANEILDDHHEDFAGSDDIHLVGSTPSN